MAAKVIIHLFFIATIYLSYDCRSLVNDNLAVRNGYADYADEADERGLFLDIYCRSILIPLLQLEEGCPKGGVVGEKEFLFYD